MVSYGYACSNPHTKTKLPTSQLQNQSGDGQSHDYIAQGTYTHIELHI